MEIVNDLRACANDGMSITAAATELGIGRKKAQTLAKSERIVFAPGTKENPPPIDALRSAVEDMKPADAVEFLLSVIADFNGVDDLSCAWPDIRLTPTERAICQFLYVREGKPVPRGDLMNALYPHTSEPPEDKIVDVYIHKTRKKLAGTGFRILTVWGVGWKLERRSGVIFPWESAA